MLKWLFTHDRFILNTVNVIFIFELSMNAGFYIQLFYHSHPVNYIYVTNLAASNKFIGHYHLINFILYLECLTDLHKNATVEPQSSGALIRFFQFFISLC